MNGAISCGAHNSVKEKQERLYSLRQLELFHKYTATYIYYSFAMDYRGKQVLFVIASLSPTGSVPINKR